MLLLQVAYLIANRPHDHAWVIAVAQNEILRFAFGVAFDELVDPTFHTGGGSIFVKQLVEDHEPHAVAKFQQLGCGRVVGGADRIHAHLLHDLKLPLHGAGKKRRAQGPLIMVQIHSLQLHPAAIEVKAVIGGEGDRANAEGRRLALNLAPFHHQSCDCCVEVRVFDVPERGIGNLSFEG